MILLGVTDVVVPWETLLLSVVHYVVIPLVAGYITRKMLWSVLKATEGFSATSVRDYA